MRANHQYIADFVNLLDPERNHIFNMSAEEAENALVSGNPDQVRRIDGQFALVKKAGEQVFMARSIGRPMRYFLAKQEAGPMLIVAERMDEIYNHLKKLNLHEQFHPSYTRMVPAHYVVRVDVIGCPDPNPSYTRFFEPQQNALEADLDAIGRQYIGTLAKECQKWLESIPEKEPVGVLFSGGIDSGSVFLVLYHTMLRMGLSPQRLKAFTLSADGGADAHQAHDFLNQLSLSLFLEVVEVQPSELDYREAINVIEDYKALDVEAATMTLASANAIRIGSTWPTATEETKT
jgi:asparagine synthase (glutamine-hydrolysing)